MKDLRKLRPLADYPFQFEIPTRYADVDPQGHINNVAVAGLYQESRLGFHRSLDCARSSESRTLVAHHAMDYLAEIHYPGAVVIGIAVEIIGNTSYKLLSAIFQNGLCAGLASTVMVHGNASGSAAVPARMREELERRRLAAT